MCLVPPVLLLRLIIRKVRFSPPFFLLLKISSSRTCSRTVRLVIFTSDLHGVVTLRECVETVAPLPTVDVMAVIVVATSVTRQYRTHQNQKKKLRRQKLKGSEKQTQVHEKNQHEDTKCEKPLHYQQTHARQVPKTHKTNTTNGCSQFVDTPSQTERVSFVEEVFMMSEESAECDAVREVLESPIYRDYDPTLHRRRSISLPDGPTVTVTKARQCNSPRPVHCMRRGRQKAQFFTRFDNQRMDNFVSSVGACRRHVPTVAGGPHDSMIADALTNRRGNSVTMLKFVKTGQLSIVDEEKELAERQQFLEVRGRNQRPHRQHEGKSSGPVDWEQRYAVGCAKKIPRASELEANLSTSRFQSQF